TAASRAAASNPRHAVRRIKCMHSSRDRRRDATAGCRKVDAGFRKRSRSNNELKRDDNSKKRDHALVRKSLIYHGIGAAAGRPRSLPATARDHINDAFNRDILGADRCAHDTGGWGRVTTVPKRLIGLRRGVAACGLAAVVVGAVATTDSASAQARLDARYVV